MPLKKASCIGRLWAVITSFALFYLVALFARSRWAQGALQHRKDTITKQRSPDELYNTLNLSEEECKAAFPDLTSDLDATVALGTFTLKREHGNGPLQARVKDGQLYIVHAEDSNTLSPELLQARTSALHQIARALLTSPAPLPDTYITLNIHDQAHGTSLSYTRPGIRVPASSQPPITRSFLMPHFAFWSWPLGFIGSMARAREAISAIEEEEEKGKEEGLSFADKDPRVVWRGSVALNPPQNPALRKNLLRVAGGAGWADVRGLEGYEMEDDDEGEGRGKGVVKQGMSDGDGDGKANEGTNATASTRPMMIEDFCRHKYTIYTDGLTYSGRLPFLQMCRSVLLTPPIAWLQHTTHLIKPLFSQDLDLPGQQRQREQEQERDLPTEPNRNNGYNNYNQYDNNNAWSTRYNTTTANAIFVAPDWSDLEDTIAWLEDHPDVAEGIASRQRDLFVGKGYLSPAMETCYWRALLRGWSSVVRFDEAEWDDNDDGGGISWEEFSVGLQT